MRSRHRRSARRSGSRGTRYIPASWSPLTISISSSRKFRVGMSNLLIAHLHDVVVQVALACRVFAEDALRKCSFRERRVAAAVRERSSVSDEHSSVESGQKRMISARLAKPPQTSSQYFADRTARVIEVSVRDPKTAVPAMNGSALRILLVSVHIRVAAAQRSCRSPAACFTWQERAWLK